MQNWRGGTVRLEEAEASNIFSLFSYAFIPTRLAEVWQHIRRYAEKQKPGCWSHFLVGRGWGVISTTEDTREAKKKRKRQELNLWTLERLNQCAYN